MYIHDHQPANGTVISGFSKIRQFLCLLLVLANILVVLPGCIKSNAGGIPVSKDSVLWEGYIFQDRELFAAFGRTLACLAPYESRLQSGYPYVVKVAAKFVCGSTKDAVGCTDFSHGRIYLVEDYSRYAINHEIVHWATGVGAAAHGQDLMIICGTAAVVEAMYFDP